MKSQNSNKNRTKSIIIVLLVCVLIISATCNILFYHKYTIERNRVKNVVSLGIGEDYFTERVQYVKVIKETDGIPEYLLTDEIDYPPVLNIDIIAQNPDYPNGCEAASATMLLHYYGINISLDDFVANNLPKQGVYDVNGERYGTNPAKYYAGNPADKKRGWGCFAPTIARALDSVIGDEYEVSDMSLHYFDELMFCLPCVVWTTTDYSEVSGVYTWQSEDKQHTYTYPLDSHTVLLVGIDKDFVYLNDPLKPEKVQKVQKDLFIKSYDSMGRQAVTITHQSLEYEENY